MYVDDAHYLRFLVSDNLTSLQHNLFSCFLATFLAPDNLPLKMCGGLTGKFQDH